METFDVEQESANPPDAADFESLPTEMVVAIMEYLPGKSLIALSEVSRRFRDLFKNDKKTMEKIRLNVDYRLLNHVDVDMVRKLAGECSFVRLHLRLDFMAATYAVNLKMQSLCVFLATSVKYLAIEGDITRRYFEDLIGMFLPQLLTLEIKKINFSGQSSVKHFSQNGMQLPLKVLKIDSTQAKEVLSYFVEATHLLTFDFRTETFVNDVVDAELLNDFVGSQRHLIRLVFNCLDLQFHRLQCIWLQSFCGVCNSQQDAATLFERLPNLTRLTVILRNYPSRILIATICGLPRLHKLYIHCWIDDSTVTLRESLEGLSNHTVQTLRITDESTITGDLIGIFRGVTSIHLNIRCDLLDLSHASSHMLQIINFTESTCNRQSLRIVIAPEQIPTDLLQFEESVLNFVGDFGFIIIGLTVGHNNWRYNWVKKVSNEFCERLIYSPELRELTIYNVHDNSAFINFLTANKFDFVGRRVNLFTPFEMDTDFSNELVIFSL